MDADKACVGPGVVDWLEAKGPCHHSIFDGNILLHTALNVGCCGLLSTCAVISPVLLMLMLVLIDVDAGAAAGAAGDVDARAGAGAAPDRLIARLCSSADAPDP